MERKFERGLVIVALAVAATSLLPVAKKTLKLARDEMEDIIVEAQFERMKKQIDKEIASALP